MSVYIQDISLPTYDNCILFKCGSAFTVIAIGTPSYKLYSYSSTTGTWNNILQGDGSCNIPSSIYSIDGVESNYVALKGVYSDTSTSAPVTFDLECDDTSAPITVSGTLSTLTIQRKPTESDSFYFSKMFSTTQRNPLICNLTFPSVHNVLDCTEMFSHSLLLSEVTFKEPLTDAVCTNMFYNCNNLVNIDATFIVSRENSWGNCFESMFEQCQQLQVGPTFKVDITNDTGGSTFRGTFRGCSSLTGLGRGSYISCALGEGNSNLFDSMFEFCTSLTTPPLKLNIDYSNTTCIPNYCFQYMFSGCTNLLMDIFTYSKLVSDDGTYEYSNLRNPTFNGEPIPIGTSAFYNMYSINDSDLHQESSYSGLYINFYFNSNPHSLGDQCFESFLQGRKVDPNSAFAINAYLSSNNIDSDGSVTDTLADRVFTSFSDKIENDYTNCLYQIVPVVYHADDSSLDEKYGTVYAQGYNPSLPTYDNPNLRWSVYSAAENNGVGAAYTLRYLDPNLDKSSQSYNILVNSSVERLHYLRSDRYLNSKNSFAKVSVPPAPPGSPRYHVVAGENIIASVTSIEGSLSSELTYQYEVNNETNFGSSFVLSIDPDDLQLDTEATGTECLLSVGSASCDAHINAVDYKGDNICFSLQGDLSPYWKFTDTNLTKLIDVHIKAAVIEDGQVIDLSEMFMDTKLITDDVSIDIYLPSRDTSFTLDMTRMFSGITFEPISDTNLGYGNVKITVYYKVDNNSWGSYSNFYTPQYSNGTFIYTEMYKGCTYSTKNNTQLDPTYFLTSDRYPKLYSSTAVGMWSDSILDLSGSQEDDYILVPSIESFYEGSTITTGKAAGVKFIDYYKYYVDEATDTCTFKRAMANVYIKNYSSYFKSISFAANPYPYCYEETFKGFRTLYGSIDNFGFLSYDHIVLSTEGYFKSTFEDSSCLNLSSVCTLLKLINTLGGKVGKSNYISGDYFFDSMFKGANIVNDNYDADPLEYLLPTPTSDDILDFLNPLPPYLCYSMFEGSTINLPPFKYICEEVYTLGEHCFESMFKNCRNLVSTPGLCKTSVNHTLTLPYSTTYITCSFLVNGSISLNNSCYKSMFEGCSDLHIAFLKDYTDGVTNTLYTNLDKLSANIQSTVFSWGRGSWDEYFSSIKSVKETLGSGINFDSAYECMFKDCTHLRYFLTTDTLFTNMLEPEELPKKVYYQMFKGCTSLGLGVPLLSENDPYAPYYEKVYYDIGYNLPDSGDYEEIPMDSYRDPYYLGILSSNCTTISKFLPINIFSSDYQYTYANNGSEVFTTWRLLPFPKTSSINLDYYGDGSFEETFMGCTNLRIVTDPEAYSLGTINLQTLRAFYYGDISTSLSGLSSNEGPVILDAIELFYEDYKIINSLIGSNEHLDSPPLSPTFYYTVKQNDPRVKNMLKDTYNPYAQFNNLGGLITTQKDTHSKFNALTQQLASPDIISATTSACPFVLPIGFHLFDPSTQRVITI